MEKTNVKCHTYNYLDNLVYINNLNFSNVKLTKKLIKLFFFTTLDINEIV